MEQRAGAIDLANREHWLAVANAEQCQRTWNKLGHRTGLDDHEPRPDLARSLEYQHVLPSRVPLKQLETFKAIEEFPRGGVGHPVLIADHGRCARNCRPSRHRGKFWLRLKEEARFIGRPGKNDD